MSDELLLDGKQYVSSKRASDLSGYAQDYIGQLSRKGLIDAQRVGGLWYVFMDSLLGYKKNADEYKPQAPQYTAPAKDPESFVTFDGKDYVSASRAAKITGYNQDYIGQLARKGSILSRQVGNRWYVDREGLQNHKREKDSLLAAVQAESVGLSRPTPVSATPIVIHRTPAPQIVHRPREAAPVHTHLSYIREDADLIPQIREKDTYATDQEVPSGEIERSQRHEPTAIPIRVDRTPKIMTPPLPPVHYQPVRKSGKTIFRATKVLTALTVVIMLSVGIVQLKDNSTYAIADSSYAASAYAAVDRIGDMLEDIVVTELVYRRTQ